MSCDTNKATLADKIYSSIRKDITENVLQPGTKINIKELSEKYGSSITPVKLALNRLISEQLIENYPRKGMKVKHVEADEIDEIFDMRLMLDLFYTKEIITSVNFNNELQKKLRSNVEQHLELVSELTSESPVDKFIKNYELDTKFHELYLKCSGNKKILEVFRYINPFLYSNYIFRRQSQKKTISGVKEHEAILNSILSYDEDSLKKNLRLHINNSKKAIELILKVDKIL